MLAALLSLSGALLWGAADFLGGLTARHLKPIVVTAIAAIARYVYPDRFNKGFDPIIWK